jgi:nicotinamide riboside transporter PnuC|tara:strand:- start:21586 stop:21840 length:255 start_codon:yes stop_codon:yes gene_type:complete
MEYIFNKIPEGPALYEFLGAVVGVIGAALVASHSEYADWGFVCFLVSNVMFITFALQLKLNWLLIMQVVFTVTSIVGIYQGFFS